jgi:hypothetical protein
MDMAGGGGHEAAAAEHDAVHDHVAHDHKRDRRKPKSGAGQFVVGHKRKQATEHDQHEKPDVAGKLGKRGGKGIRPPAP